VIGRGLLEERPEHASGALVHPAKETDHRPPAGTETIALPR